MSASLAAYFSKFRNGEGPKTWWIDGCAGLQQPIPVERDRTEGGSLRFTGTYSLMDQGGIEAEYQWVPDGQSISSLQQTIEKTQSLLVKYPVSPKSYSGLLKESRVNLQSTSTSTQHLRRAESFPPSFQSPSSSSSQSRRSAFKAISPIEISSRGSLSSRTRYVQIGPNSDRGSDQAGRKALRSQHSSLASPAHFATSIQALTKRGDDS